jgi:hypothetical protein
VKINSILFRIAVVVFAIGLTAVTFGFWGKFGGALDGYLTMVTKPDKPKDTGVVTMTIVQPAMPINKPACDKDKARCPKP